MGRNTTERGLKTICVIFRYQCAIFREHNCQSKTIIYEVLLSVVYIYIYIYILVNKANLVHNFSQYVYFFSLHVSGDYVPIIRRNNCIYTTLRICHSVWMTVWYAGCTLHTRQSVIHLQDYTRTHDQQNIFIYLRI